MGPAALSGSDFVWLIGSLCQINRLPFDAALLVQRFPAPHSHHQSIEALQSLGFRTGESGIAKASFPCIAFLKGLGYEPVFRYEKYRTEFTRPGHAGAVMLDETPIGDYLELEGSPRWIERTARALGKSPAEFITASYGALYREHCQARGAVPGNMVFRRKLH